MVESGNRASQYLGRLLCSGPLIEADETSPWKLSDSFTKAKLSCSHALQMLKYHALEPPRISCQAPQIAFILRCHAFCA
jgi:hypothetical protein